VVRCFENEDIIHVDGKVDPVMDVETINLELGLADLAQIEKRLERVTKTGRKSGDEKVKAETEKAALERISDAIDQGKPARAVALNEEEAELVAGLNLLTGKKVIYAANVNEDDLADNGDSNHHVKALREIAAAEGAQVVVVSAQVRLS
jgi:ribosome-binding ATPase YchF (GTP1/OBG family)